MYVFICGLRRLSHVEAYCARIMGVILFIKSLVYDSDVILRYKNLHYLKKNVGTYHVIKTHDVWG